MSNVLQEITNFGSLDIGFLENIQEKFYLTSGEHIEICSIAELHCEIGFLDFENGTSVNYFINRFFTDCIYFLKEHFTLCNELIEKMIDSIHCNACCSSICYEFSDNDKKFINHLNNDEKREFFEIYETLS